MKCLRVEHIPYMLFNGAAELYLNSLTDGLVNQSLAQLTTLCLSIFLPFKALDLDVIGFSMFSVFFSPRLYQNKISRTIDLTGQLRDALLIDVWLQNKN